MNNDNLELARITTDAEWQAYRELVAAENQKYGIKAEPLPESRPEPRIEPSSTVKLSQTIDKAIGLWQRDSQAIKGFYNGIREQLQSDSQYHYYQAKSYLENTVSGAMSIVEDTIGYSHQQSVNYFVDPSDFLDDYAHEGNTQEQVGIEPTDQVAEAQKADSQTSFVDKIVSKGVEDITQVEQAVYSFFDRFRAR